MTDSALIAKKSSRRLRRTGFYVKRVGNKWVVREAGTERVIGVFESEALALRSARSIARRKGGEVRSVNAAGRVLGSFTIGFDGFEKISAVEGIRYSRTEKAAARGLASTNAAPHERAKALLLRLAITPPK